MKTNSRCVYVNRCYRYGCAALRQRWCRAWTHKTDLFNACQTLLMSQCYLGNFSASTLHYCNPEHGVAYSQIDRRMRDDEMEDFMKSVKGWKYLYQEEEEKIKRQENEVKLSQESAHIDSEDSHHSMESTTAKLQNSNNSNNDDNDDAEERTSITRANDEPGPPPPSEHFLAHDAIKRTFTFDTFNEAYLYFGRLYCFCYFEDKYPPVEWEHNKITIYLYSPKYKGLTRREARIAAFANDQYNMFRKSKKQQAKLQELLLGKTNSKSTQDKVDGKVEHYNNSNDGDSTKKSSDTEVQAVPKLKIAEIFKKYAPASLQQELQSQSTLQHAKHAKVENVGEVFDFKLCQKK